MARSVKGIKIFAHRGGSQLSTENTIGAFRHAEELGVDGIECDLNQTADGELVILHDFDLSRVAGIDRIISDITLPELSEITLNGGGHVPTFRNVLDNTHAELMIDLKDPDTLSPLIIFIEKDRKILKRCTFVSFFHETLKQLRMRYPSAVTGAHFMEIPDEPISALEESGADFLSLNYEGVTKDFVVLCHRKGIRVNVWTPNTLEDISSCIEAGVDSIVSDRPEIALKILGRN